MKGNEAMAEPAIQAGCDAYFGYPITPQAEVLEWMARRMPELGRTFIQAERARRDQHGTRRCGDGRGLRLQLQPGHQLDGRGHGYMAGSEVPVVLLNVMRGGPGLGSIGASQSDYFQAVKATAMAITVCPSWRRRRSQRPSALWPTHSRSPSAIARR